MGGGGRRGPGPRAGPVDDSANPLLQKGLVEEYPAIMGINTKHKD